MTIQEVPRHDVKSLDGLLGDVEAGVETLIHLIGIGPTAENAALWTVGRINERLGVLRCEYNLVAGYTREVAS